MMQYGLIYKAANLLSNSENPLLEAEMLLAHAVGVSRLSLLIDNYDITEKQKESFSISVRKRLGGIPVSKIIGIKEFWSLDFKVNKNVLDPRPDSETIINTLLNLKINKQRHCKIADLGTGSGCLAITAAKEFPNAKVFAFEKSGKACAVARENIKNLKFSGRVKLFNTSWDNCKGLFDIILSNPPYIASRTINSLADEVKFFDPSPALNGGFNGIVKYFGLFKLIKKILKPQGIAIIELGMYYKPLLREVRRLGFVKSYTEKDLGGNTRIIVLKSKHSCY